MDGIFFLMSVAGIGVVMWWVMQNDQVPPDRPTRGIFAMYSGATLARRRKLRGWVATTEEAPPKRRKSRF